MAKDPEVLAHQEWLGYLQPVGLVVSPAALVDAGAYVDRDVIDVQNRFKEWVGEVPVGESEPVASVEDLRGLLCGVFGWRPSDFLGTPEAEPVPDSLEVPLTDYHEPPLRPTYAVRGPAPQNPAADAPTAMWSRRGSSRGCSTWWLGSRAA